MTTIVEQQNTIDELLNSGRPVTLETIAQALSVTAQEAAHLLPEGSATFAPGSDFESVWAAIAEWEKITFIVTAHGNVIEVETKLVTGKAAFFTTSGDVAYSMYVGREKHKLIESAKEKFLALQQKYKA